MQKFIFLSMILFALSCTSTKQAFDPETSKKDYISFGNGGGFTGQIKKYYLLRDGSVWTSGTGGNEKLGSLSKNTSTQIFKNFTTLGMDKLTLNEPGNKYYFIGHRVKNLDLTLKWGKQPLTETSVETFYQILMKSVKDLGNKN